MKIVTLISARYPTEKAYGVTIGNTMKTLTDAGISNSILTWGKKYEDEYNNSIQSIKDKPWRIPFRFYRVKFISQLSFIINQIIFSIYFEWYWRKNQKECILWTREPLTLLTHAIFNSGSRYLIDLHHSVGILTRIVIFYLKRKGILSILVLNESLRNEYSKIFLETKVIYLPMGVPSSFFKVSKRKKDRDFVIGYLGKGFSSGNDNELIEIVHAAKELENFSNIKFKFVGLELNYKEKLEKALYDLGVSPNRFVFIDHISHSEVPRTLSDFDVGIIPYPETTYNSERFPIKILEYASIGIPIVSSDTMAHRRILNHSFTAFYHKGNTQSLCDSILYFVNNPEIYARMSKNARNFALEFTYEERVQKLLKFINGHCD